MVFTKVAAAATHSASDNSARRSTVQTLEHGHGADGRDGEALVDDHAACDHDERYRRFRGPAAVPDPSAGGNVMQAFRATYFTAMKARRRMSGPRLEDVYAACRSRR